MRNQLFYLLIFVLGFGSSNAQKHDYVWLQGYGHGNSGFDSLTGLTFGITFFDFNSTPRQVYYDSLKMNFSFSNTSYSDSDGNLLLYTNGIYVANSLDEKIENSDSLNIEVMDRIWDYTIYEWGYRTAGGVYIIPVVGQPDKYYVLHILVEELTTNKYQGTKFLVTYLDMAQNGGHGKAVYKNRSVLDGVLSFGFAMVRHANGRDWWALVQKRNSNCYYRILVDTSGVHALPDVTCAGVNIPDDDWVGPLSFTPDGNKFIYQSAIGGLNIYDFDRCDGTISNPRHLALNSAIDSGWNGFGLSASPNSRYLYVSFTYHLYQFDLWAADIMASIDTVAKFDETYMPGATVYSTSQLGPDGKIYISTNGGGDTVCHVIDRPNEGGDSCLVRPHSLRLPSACIGLPNFPNYRLGALPGSPCDTLTGLNETFRLEKERILKVFPSPATDYITIDYGFTDWSKGEAILEITNELGQVVHQQLLPMYSGFQKIDVAQFADGMYTAFVKRGIQVVATAKFVRQ